MLVDTSVWIDFLNGKETTQVVILSNALASEDIVFITPTILQEVLQGIREDKKYEQVKTILMNFPMLEWQPYYAAIAAAELYRKLRKEGVTIRRANDCLIAAFAIKYSLPLLCSDTDFELIARKTSLILS